MEKKTAVTASSPGKQRAELEPTYHQPPKQPDILAHVSFQQTTLMSIDETGKTRSYAASSNDGNLALGLFVMRS